MNNVMMKGPKKPTQAERLGVNGPTTIEVDRWSIKTYEAYLLIAIYQPKVTEPIVFLPEMGARRDEFFASVFKEWDSRNSEVKANVIYPFEEGHTYRINVTEHRGYVKFEGWVD